MPSTQAIVTLTLTPRRQAVWREHCSPGWFAYAERHGFDVICLEEPLDDSERARSRHGGWQKCLILEQPFAERYERIVWIDADVLINPHAPSITEDVPVERVGAVDEYATPSRAEHSRALERLYRHWERNSEGFHPNLTVAEFYTASGLPPRDDGVVQTGVMVLSPGHHRELLAGVYDGYEDRGGNLVGEMRALSHELLEAGVVTWLDPRFNYTWSTYQALHSPVLLGLSDHPHLADRISEALADVFFLHCTGTPPELRLARTPPPPAREPSRGVTAPRAPATFRTPAGSATPPVVLFLYARPDAARQALKAIRNARPTRLLVVADTPPPDAAPELIDRAHATRALLNEVDWDCELTVNLAEEHQGLNRRLVSGLDWVFEQVEEAIVLEEDCVAEPTFFRFCQELLDLYRNEDRVLAIAGNDFILDPGAAPNRYRFSRYTLVWGWATWREAWRRHDPQMSAWPVLRDSGWLEDLLGDHHAAAYWSHIFEQTYRGELGWDYAWTFTCWRLGTLCAHPEVNLVSNVGFDAQATNTQGADSVFAHLPTRSAVFPLEHPACLARDERADALLEEAMFSGNLVRLFRRIRRGRQLAGRDLRP